MIGSRKETRDLSRIVRDSGLKVVSQKYISEEANEVLAKLKNSQIQGRAVLIPRQSFMKLQLSFRPRALPSQNVSKY